MRSEIGPTDLKNILRGAQFCLVAIDSARIKSHLRPNKGPMNPRQVNGQRFDGLSLLVFRALTNRHDSQMSPR
jgi:hypothetical protein